MVEGKPNTAIGPNFNWPFRKKSKISYTFVWTPLFVGEEGRPIRFVAPTKTLASRSLILDRVLDAAMTKLRDGAVTTESPIGRAMMPFDQW